MSTMPCGFAVKLVLVLFLAHSAQSGWWEDIPVAGHIAGIVAYAKGETEAGNRCMKGASRTTALIIGGVAGGPAGALAAGAAYNATQYSIDKAVNGDSAQLGGTLGAFEKLMDSDDSSDALSNAGMFVLDVGLDAVSGIGGGCSGATKTFVSTAAKKGVSTAVKETGKVIASQGAKTYARASASSAVKNAVNTAVSCGNEDEVLATAIAISIRLDSRRDVRTETETESEEEKEDKRPSINVKMTNFSLVLQHLPNRHMDLVCWQFNMSLRRLQYLQKYFITYEYDSNTSPDEAPPHHRPFPKPLEQSEAKCCVVTCSGGGSSGEVQVVKIPTLSRNSGYKYDSSVYCTMISERGTMSEGLSLTARRKLIHAEGTEQIWLHPDGHLLDNTGQRFGPDTLVTRQYSNLPENVKDIDRCAEHQAALHLYSLDEQPISAMSFRIDTAGRIHSVPRCNRCERFEFGDVLTDHIPQYTWLNAPHMLNVYV